MAGTSKKTRQPLRLDADSASELECPVCLEYAVPPIVLCKIGHFICGICRNGVTKCVICREAYTDTRAYAIENIVSKIKVKCRHTSCKEIHSVVTLKEHLENCDYRPVICNYRFGRKCEEKLIEFDQFVQHLTTVHCVDRRSTAILAYRFQDIIASEHTHVLHIHDGVNFIINSQMVNSVFFLWVSAMLTDSEARNYFFDFRIGQLLDEKIDLERRNIQWTTGVSSVHKTLQDVEKAGDCVALTKEGLIPLLEFIPGDEDRHEYFHFWIEFQIRKK